MGDDADSAIFDGCDCFRPLVTYHLGYSKGQCYQMVMYDTILYGYEAINLLSGAEKRALAPQDIVLLTYQSKIPVVSLVRKPKLLY